MVTVGLNARYMTTTTREHLKRNAAGTGKQVKGCDILNIHVTHNDIKDILLCEVRRRTCLERTRHIKMPSFVFSRYNPHYSIIISKGIPSISANGERLRLALTLISWIRVT